MKTALVATIVAVVLLLAGLLYLKGGSSGRAADDARIASESAASSDAPGVLSGELGEKDAPGRRGVAGSASDPMPGAESGPGPAIVELDGSGQPKGTVAVWIPGNPASSVSPVPISLDEASGAAGDAEFEQKYRGAVASERSIAYELLHSLIVDQIEGAIGDKQLKPDQIAAIEREMAWLKEHLEP